jgi:prepilin-type N-terminal cleavage/methylation domain-containing protein
MMTPPSQRCCSPRPQTRRGFTLLEVMLAIVLTAVAVATASLALRTAATARDRVAEHRQTLERESRLRTMLTDMLRHAPSASSVDEPLLRVWRTPTGETQLVFLSKGVRAPFGTGPAWRVMLTQTDRGLVLDALAIGVGADEAALHTVLPGVHSLSVQVMEHTGGLSAARWRDDWPLERARPSVIAIGFGADRELPPLIVSLDPLATVAVQP